VTPEQLESIKDRVKLAESHRERIGHYIRCRQLLDSTENPSDCYVSFAGKDSSYGCIPCDIYAPDGPFDKEDSLELASRLTPILKQFCDDMLAKHELAFEKLVIE
jgi:hypothetical protein